MNPQTTENAYDSVLVANIDMGCEDISVDIVKISNRVVDDQGNVASSIYDKHEQWNHKDYFQVKFDGKPYRIAPGRTALFPRFIAEHFAKHLSDHILQKMEETTGRKGLVQSAVERPKLISQILKEINADIQTMPTSATETTPLEVAQPEPIDTDPVVDAGVVPNTAMGELQPEPPTLADLLKVAGEDPSKVDRIPLEDTSIVDETKPQPTRKQLIEMCYNQSIDINGTENKAQLIEKLKRG